VQGACDEFLAGSAFSCNEDGAFGIRNALDNGEGSTEAGALADDAVELVTRAELAL
jgi:hypothetical protein